MLSAFHLLSVGHSVSHSVSLIFILVMPVVKSCERDRMTITILVSFSHHPRRSPAYGTSEASEGSAGDDDTRMMIGNVQKLGEIFIRNLLIVE